MELDILALGTHPDDVELFCGGTIIKMVRQGHKLGIIDLTEGELSTRGNVETRKKELQQAAKILKIKIRENLKLTDGNLVNSADHRLQIIERIRKFRPRIVLIPYWADRHPDHENASKLLSESCFYSGLSKIKSTFPEFRPQYIIYYFHHWVEKPTFIVDISEEFAKKMEAIKAYKSQFYDPGSKEPQTYISDKSFLKSIETRARYFGYQIGVDFGEPFLVKSVLKIDNLLNIFA